jgi:hypothetical protein
MFKFYTLKLISTLVLQVKQLTGESNRYFNLNCIWLRVNLRDIKSVLILNPLVIHVTFYNHIT